MASTKSKPDLGDLRNQLASQLASISVPTTPPVPEGSLPPEPAGLGVAREALAAPAKKAVSPKTKPSHPRAARQTGDTDYLEFNAKLFREDQEQIAMIQDLMRKETGRVSISIAAAIRVAIRAFQSKQSLAEIILNVQAQDGRGRWSRPQ